jgi:hypothetical protein
MVVALLSDLQVVRTDDEEFVGAARDQQKRIADFNARRRCETGQADSDRIRARLNVLADTWLH